MDYWIIATAVYLLLAVITAIPVLKAWLREVGRDVDTIRSDGRLEKSTFSEDQKKRLLEHRERINGTLGFWKHRARAFRVSHAYVIWWLSTAAVLTPVLAQAISPENASKWFLTILSAHAAICLAVGRAFRVEQNYRAFRSGESDFFDLERQLLDIPGDFGKTEQEQIDNFVRKSHLVRRATRLAEIENTPSVGDVGSQTDAQSVKQKA